MPENCERCGNELVNTISSKRKFCNDVCRAKYRREHANQTGTYEVTCRSCGEIFRTYHNNKNFCSKECRVSCITKHPVNREKIIDTRCCNLCSQEFETSSLSTKFCSKKCRVKYFERILTMRRRKHYRGGDKSITLEKLIKINNNICALCGDECHSSDYVVDEKGTVICGNYYPSVDHIMPLSKDGKHEWNNVQLAHRKCNILKSNIIK